MNLSIWTMSTLTSSYFQDALHAPKLCFTITWLVVRSMSVCHEEAWLYRTLFLTLSIKSGNKNKSMSWPKLDLFHIPHCPSYSSNRSNPLLHPHPEPSGTCALGNCQVQRSSRTVQLRAANIFQRHSIKANGFHFCLVAWAVCQFSPRQMVEFVVRFLTGILK